MLSEATSQWTCWVCDPAAVENEREQATAQAVERSYPHQLSLHAGEGEEQEQECLSILYVNMCICEYVGVILYYQRDISLCYCCHVPLVL